jgi:hypothetical protein
MASGLMSSSKSQIVSVRNISQAPERRHRFACGVSRRLALADSPSSGGATQQLLDVTALELTALLMDVTGGLRLRHKICRRSAALTLLQFTNMNSLLFSSIRTALARPCLVAYSEISKTSLRVAGRPRIKS